MTQDALERYDWQDVVAESVAAMVPASAEVVEVREEQWEYKIAVVAAAMPELAQDQLNFEGIGGWELVSVRPVDSPFTNEVWYYFKRRHEHVSTSDEG